MSDSNTCTPLENFVARAKALYSLPAVAMDVLRLTNCPDVDAAALTACIERDPALVGKVLRTVNSSLFGAASNVADLSQAIALLGIKPLKLLVLGFSLPPQLLSGLEQQHLQNYWRNTLIKAVAARELAQEAAGVDPDEAFLAGMLEDIGLLVLLQELGEPYALFLDKAHAEQGDLLLLELETLGFDHRLLSARLLMNWGLPESLWRAVAETGDRRQDETDDNSGNHLAEVLTTAEMVCDSIVDNDGESLEKLLRQNEDHQQWANLAGRLQKKVDQLAGAFDVALPEGDDYQQIIRQAHAQLAIAAEEAVQHSATPAADTTAWNETQDLEAAASAFQREAMREFAALGESVPVPSDHELPQTATLAQVAVDPGWLGTLARAVSACRRLRQPLSLLLIEIDDFDDIAFEYGADGAREHIRRLVAALSALTDEDTQTQLLSDTQIAVLVRDADRASAVETARRLMDAARSGAIGPQGDRITLSVGASSVALPAKNFPADALVEAAQRCLFGVRAGGGDGVKSIDIY